MPKSKAIDHPLAEPTTPFAAFMQKMTASFSQAELARRLGISDAEVSNFVSGKRPPTKEVIKAFRTSDTLRDYYPSCMLAAQRTLGIALPFEIDGIGIEQEKFIYSLSLLWDKPVGEDFYRVLNTLVESKLRELKEI